MSESELHILRARLRGGALNKARRGELKTPLPVGFTYNSENKIVLHPDKQVQESIHLLFKMFHELGSAWQVLKSFSKKGLLFPRQQRTGLYKGEFLWGKLSQSGALRVLKNPRYAGIYFYGRAHHSKGLNGKNTSKLLPRDQWKTFLPNSHEAYISVEEFEQNQRQLAQNKQNYVNKERKTPPREGPALLQGIAICGQCGRRMTLRYHTRSPGDLYPIYVCERLRLEYSTGRICQYIPGAGIDESIGEFLLESVTPLALEVAVNVQAQLQTRLEEADSLRKKQVERAQYEAEAARHRYMQVDPKNRLVADNLEADWNEKLRAVREAQEDYKRQCTIDGQILTREQKEKILALSVDFPKLWNDRGTPDREKKRMVRLLLEDVTLTRDEEKISVGVRFKGGATRLLTLPIPLNGFMARKTRPETVEEVERLLEHYYDLEIADILNDRGVKSGDSLPFTAISVRRLRRAYKLKDRFTHLREKGMLTRKEMIMLLGTADNTLRNWKNKNWIKTHAYGNTIQTILYEPPSEDFYPRIGEDPYWTKDRLSMLKQRVAGGVV